MASAKAKAKEKEQKVAGAEVSEIPLPIGQAGATVTVSGLQSRIPYIGNVLFVQEEGEIEEGEAFKQWNVPFNPVDNGDGSYTCTIDMSRTPSGMAGEATLTLSDASGTADGPDGEPLEFSFPFQS